MEKPTTQRISIPRGDLIGGVNGYPSELDRPFWTVIAHQEHTTSGGKQIVMEVVPVTKEIQFILFVGLIRKKRSSNLIDVVDAFNEVI